MGSQKKTQPEKGVISDPRFSSVHSDPRFRDAPKRNSKIPIDSRFSRMFTDKNFATSKLSIDKRGKTKEVVDNNNLKRYYRLDEREIDDGDEKMKMKNKRRKGKFGKHEVVGDDEETEVNARGIDHESEEEEEKPKIWRRKGKFNVRGIDHEEKMKSKIDERDDDDDDDDDEEKTRIWSRKGKFDKRKIDDKGEKVKNKSRKVTEKFEIDDDDVSLSEEEETDEEEEKPKNKSLKGKFGKEKIGEVDSHDEENEEEEEEKAKNKRRKGKFGKDKIEKAKNKSRKSIESDDEGESEGEEEELKVKKVLNTRLEPESEGSEEEDDEEGSDEGTSSTSSSESDSDSDMEDYVEDEDDTFMEEENIPEIDKETNRLAVVNMDWSQVKAVDLFVLLSSFLPKGGEIKSVAVHPSEFGHQRMEEEAMRGPVGLFDGDKEKEDDDDDDDDDVDEETLHKKLRKYELSRLRYYYAVVECDSVAAADYLYTTCDGLEFERSSVKLDLRFIPDSLEPKHLARDVATEAPSNYDGLEFETRALQQSKVDITWDDDEPQRKKALRRKYDDDQLAEMELNEYIASDDSGTEDDERDSDKYLALLQSGEGSGGSEDEEGQDMEVTFNTGLEDISKRILEKKDKESETVWEAHLRKMKEKKKAKKTNANSSDDEIFDSAEEVSEQPDDFFIDDPSIKVKGAGKHSSTEKKKSETAEAEASRAELELLLADDNGADSSLKGYNLKPKKAKGKKGKKGKEIPDESKIPTVDYEDPRFSQMLNSPLFALDPTDPQFKRSATYARQLVQKQRTGDTPDATGETLTSSGKSVSKDEHMQSDPQPPKTQKPELSLMVKSIKRKAKQQRASSGDVSRLLPAPKRRKK